MELSAKTPSSVRRMGPPAPATVVSSVEEISLLQDAFGANDMGDSSEALAGVVAVTWWTGLMSTDVPAMAEPSVSVGAMTRAARCLRVRRGTRMRL